VSSIPYADARAFRAAEHRTTLIRVGLAVALLGTLTAAFLLSRSPQSNDSLLPAGTSPVVVLDLSWSTSSDYKQIGAALRELAASNRNIGLIVFSDAAYEMFPPGTPSRELRSLLRFFRGPKSRRASSPWASSLSGGTRVSTALLLARDVLLRERIAHGSVVLVSDLGDAPNDRAALSAAVLGYVRAGIPLRVVGIDPTPENEQLFHDMLGIRPIRPRTQPSGAVVSTPSSGLPLALLVVAAVFLGLLAVNELACARLRWSEA
jgi:von Willebrand factor type A domain